MNANSWREVGIELNLMKKNDKERITKRDNTANKLNKVLSKKKTSKVKTPLLMNCLHDSTSR